MTQSNEPIQLEIMHAQLADADATYLLKQPHYLILVIIDSPHTGSHYER